MAGQKFKFGFVCYLLATSFVFTTLGQSSPLSDEDAKDVARDILKDLEKELDKSEATALEDPDNDLDNEERPRIFFLIPFLAKLAVVLVKIAIKAVPVIIKAAAVVKAKVAAVAATSLTKTAIVAAAKKTAVFVAKEVIIDSAFNYVYDKVSEAVSPSAPATTEAPVRQDDDRIHKYYETGSEECSCWARKKCACCVKPKGLETGCFNMTMKDSLWKEDSKIKIGVFYGGKNIITRRIKVNKPKQRCALMPEPFHKTNLCISSYGRTAMRSEVTQCFSVYFNQRGLSKCIVQDRKMNLKFEEDEF